MKLVTDATKDLQTKLGKKVDENGKIAKADVTTIGETWKKEHDIVEGASVVDGGTTWDLKVDLGDKSETVKGKAKAEGGEEGGENLSSEEHDKQVNAGLAEIDVQVKNHDKDNDKALTKEEAEQTLAAVKNKYPVFKVLKLISGDKKWKYEYQASPGETRELSDVEEDKPNLPDTVITNDGKHGSGTMWVKADPLTNKGPDGSKPHQDPPGWDHAQDLNKEQDLWVRGHLLNEHLHGPGEAWNLVPLTQKNNSAMRDGPEKDGKEWVAADKIVYYKTSVNFYSSEAPPIKYFPSKVIINWYYTENGKKIEEKSLPLTQEKPPANPANIEYNLNTIGRVVLQTQFGVPQIFATEIVHVRDDVLKKQFSGFMALKVKMQQYYENKLDPSTNFSAKKMESFDSNIAIIQNNLSKKKLVIKKT